MWSRGHVDLPWSSWARPAPPILLGPPAAQPALPPAPRPAHAPQEQIDHEVSMMGVEILRLGQEQPDGSFTVTFGVLFDDDRCANIFEALVGTLKACKKRGVLTYGSPLLLKGTHDNELITLTPEAAAVARTVEPAEAVIHGSAGSGSGSAGDPAGAAAAPAPAAAAAAAPAPAPAPAPAAAGAGGAVPVGSETMSLADIQARRAELDPTQLEMYLADDEFSALFGMDKAAFGALPGWKKTAQKKNHGLF